MLELEGRAAVLGEAEGEGVGINILAAAGRANVGVGRGRVAEGHAAVHQRQLPADAGGGGVAGVADLQLQAHQLARINDSVAIPGRRVPVGAIFNQNGWGRSLHFLAAWVLVAVGLVYVVAGVIAGHFRGHFLGGREALSVAALWRDLREHLRGFVPLPTGGPDYGPLQRTSYFVVVFLVTPLLVLTGLTMSPAVAAAAPVLLDLFGGHQSARTLHFFGFVAISVFVVGHVAMVVLTGFGRHMRAMIVGR